MTAARNPRDTAHRSQASDAHAIAAVTGLQGALNARVPVVAPESLASLTLAAGEHEDTAFRICEHAGAVYVGMGWSQGGSPLGGKVYTLDIATGALTLVFDTGQQSVRSLVSYHGTLYAGTGVGGRVYAWDGASATLAFTGVTGQSIISGIVYHDVLYMGATGGAVYTFDGATWATLATLPTPVEGFALFGGMLYIATGNETAGTSWAVYATDGTSISVVYTTPSTDKHQALSLTPYRGCLYVTEYDPTGAASLTRYDPTTGSWTVIAVPGSPTAIYASCVYRDVLYLGTHPHATVCAYDGGAVRVLGTATGQQSVRDLVVVGDRLLAAARVEGTADTGSAILVHGDARRQPSLSGETPQDKQLFSTDDVYVGSFDPRMITAALAIPANRAYYNRFIVRKARYVTGIRTSVGTASGNICVGIYSNGTDAPAKLLATSGSVACPASGMRLVALTAGLWLIPGSYWIAIAADNGTATFNALNPANIFAALSQYQDAAFPLPAAATGTGGLSGRQYPLWV